MPPRPRKEKKRKGKQNATKKKCGGQKGFDPCTQAVMNAIDTGLPDRPIRPGPSYLTQPHARRAGRARWSATEGE